MLPSVTVGTNPCLRWNRFSGTRGGWGRRGEEREDRREREEGLTRSTVFRACSAFLLPHVSLDAAAGQTHSRWLHMKAWRPTGCSEHAHWPSDSPSRRSLLVMSIWQRVTVKNLQCGLRIFCLTSAGAGPGAGPGACPPHTDLSLTRSQWREIWT